MLHDGRSPAASSPAAPAPAGPAAASSSPPCRRAAPACRAAAPAARNAAAAHAASSPPAPAGASSCAPRASSATPVLLLLLLLSATVGWRRSPCWPHNLQQAPEVWRAQRAAGERGREAGRQEAGAEAEGQLAHRAVRAGGARLVCMGREARARGAMVGRREAGMRAAAPRRCLPSPALVRSRRLQQQWQRGSQHGGTAQQAPLTHP